MNFRMTIGLIGLLLVATFQNCTGQFNAKSVSQVAQTSTGTNAPEVVQFRANPTTITSGQTASLTWSVNGALTITINPGNTDVTNLTQLNVSPTSTTRYTLTAANATGSTTASLDLAVNPTPNSGNGIVIDLSYVDKNSSQFSRFKAMVDLALSGSPDYSFDAIEAAYMYKLTNDPKYCEYAVQFVQSRPNNQDQSQGFALTTAYSTMQSGQRPAIAGDSYLEVGPAIASLAITYDWCNAFLSNSQKSEWAAYANQAIYNVWHPDLAAWGGVSYPWSGWSIDNPGDNYFYSFIEATMFWGLASRNSTTLSFLRDVKIQELINYFKLLPGGGSLEGTGYGASHMRLFNLYQVWRDSTGEDIGNLSSHMTDSIRFWVHATTPSRNEYTPVGDLARDSYPSLFDYHRRLVIEARYLTKDLSAQNLASWWLNHISVTQMGRRVDSRFDLYPAGASAINDLPIEPLTYHATGVGRIFARTDWGTSALWMSFVAGKYNESHAHHDQGSFVLANNGFLAVTNNIYSSSGIEQADEYQNTVRFTQGGQVIRQVEGTTSTMTVQSLTPSGVVDVTGNLTPAYNGNPGVQNWTRNIKFSNRKLTVTDNFTVATGVTGTFQLHVPVQPTISGNTITAGALKIKILSPANPTISVVNLGRFRIDISGSPNGYTVELSDQ